jgi:hypothetical protein
MGLLHVEQMCFSDMYSYFEVLSSRDKGTSNLKCRIRKRLKCLVLKLFQFYIFLRSYRQRNERSNQT